MLQNHACSSGAQTSLCQSITCNTRQFALVVYCEAFQGKFFLFQKVCGSTNSSYTFSEVKDLSRKFACGLNKRGIKKDDVVAILAPNVPEFAIVFLGILQLGAIVTCVNPYFTSKELTNQLKEANAKCIIAVHQLMHRAKEAEEELNTGHVIAIGEDDQCESISDILKETGEASFPSVKVNAKEDVAILPFSSGWSGLPKGVMITHYNLIALGSVLKSEEFFSYNKNSKLLNLIPFHRAFGMIAVLSISLRKGSTLISVPRFDENLCFHLLQYYKVCIQSSTKPSRGQSHAIGPIFICRTTY